MGADAMEFEQHEAIVTVTINRTELNQAEMRRLIEAMVNRVYRNHARHFVIDLRYVKFLESTCVGRLIVLLEHIKPMGGQVVLANCHSNVELLFRMTRLDNLFGLYDSIEEAAKACGAATTEIARA